MHGMRIQHIRMMVHRSKLPPAYRGHYDTAAVESVDSPAATLGQRVRAQLARERALKSSRKKKSKSPTEAGATARDRVRRELAKARQAKDAEAMKNKLDVLQNTARAWEEKVPNNDGGDKEEEVVEEEEEEEGGSRYIRSNICINGCY